MTVQYLKKYTYNKYIVNALAVCVLAMLLNAISYSQSQQSQPKGTIGAMGRMVFIVDNINPGSVAEKSGLAVGDLIVKVYKNQFESIDEFEQLASKAVTSESSLQVLRLNVDDFLSQPIQTLPLVVTSPSISTLGVTGRLAFMIERVVENGPASKAGFRQGDLIEKVNGVSTSSIQQFKNMSLSAPDTEVKLRVLRPEARKLTPYTVVLRTVAVSELVIR